MGAFGSKTQKPTMLLTNSVSLCKLNGRRIKRRRGGKGLCKRYNNSKGERAYCGTKSLKRSQRLALYLLVTVYEMLMICKMRPVESLRPEYPKEVPTWICKSNCGLDSIYETRAPTLQWCCFLKSITWVGKCQFKLMSVNLTVMSQRCRGAAHDNFGQPVPRPGLERVPGMARGWADGMFALWSGDERIMYP